MRRCHVGLACHPRLLGAFQQPTLEGPQRARAAQPACAAELVAEAGLEVVGVVDHRAPAHQAPQRGGRHGAVGDHPAAAGRVGEAGGLCGQLGGDAAREGGGHAAQADRPIGEQPARTARGHRLVQLDPGDRLERCVGLGGLEAGVEQVQAPVGGERASDPIGAQRAP